MADQSYQTSNVTNSANHGQKPSQSQRSNVEDGKRGHRTKSQKPLRPEELVALSASISSSRRHKHGGNNLVRQAPGDEATFGSIAHQVMSDLSRFSGPQLCAIA